MEMAIFNRGSTLKLPYFTYHDDGSVYDLTDVDVIAKVYNKDGCKVLLDLTVTKTGINTCEFKATNTNNLPLDICILKVTIKDGENTIVQDSHYFKVVF